MPVDWSALRDDETPALPDLTPKKGYEGKRIDGEFPSRGDNLGVSGPLPAQRIPSMPVALKTPVTDRFMDDAAFMATVKEHAGKLRAIEHQTQGGDPNDFMAHAAMGFRNSKDAVSDILDDIKGSFLNAKNSTELVDLRAKQVMGVATESEASRADYLSARRKPWVSPNSVDGFFKEVPGAVAAMAGQMAGEGDMVGGQILAGAALGTLVKPGQGTLAGMGAGFLSASGYLMGKTAMGEFYDRMLKAKTQDGKPVDRDAARGAALVLGGLNGALGILPLGAALSRTGLGSVLGGPAAARWLAQAVGSPAGAQVLARIATQFAAGAGAQAVIGGLQELNSIMAEHAVMLNADPKAYGQAWQESHDAQDELARVKAAGRGGAQIGIGIGFIEAALHGSGESVALVDNAGEVSNRVFQEDRTKAKVWGDQVQMEHGREDMTLPRDKLEGLFKELGLEGDDLKAVMPDVHAAMEASQGDAKAEIPVSLGDLTAYIANTKQWPGLRGYLRDGAGKLTLNELAKEAKNIGGDVESLKPGASLPPELKSVYDDIYKQLSATKAGAPAAERAATIYTSTINAIAEATGQSPKAIHDRWGVKFVEVPEAAIDERAAGVPGATVQDTGKYKVMEFDKPVPDDMKTYLAELREAGTKFGDKVKPDGTLGELFALLSKSAGSPTDAARVLAGMGWDGIDTGKTKVIWRPDANIPKTDPLSRKLGATDFKPGRTTISFTQHANVATVAHELSHLFLRMWNDIDLTDTTVTNSKSREATLAAVDRLNQKFKQEHTARATVFANEQKARRAEYEESKKKVAPTEEKLAAEKFQDATAAETGDNEQNLEHSVTDYEARARREAKAAKQAEREAKTRDKNFEADEGAKETEFLNSQDELEEKHDSRMAALKSGVKAKTQTVRSPMADSMALLHKWLGVDASGGLDAKAEEKFAKAFVSYLRDGEAPSLTLRPVFDSYKHWLTMLYGTEKSLGAPLSPEIRQVFDKLVASQKAIDYAKKNLGEPLFQNKPGIMTDAQFAKYKQELSNLTATAKSEMEREIFSHMNKDGIDAFEKQRDALREQLIATDSTHSLVSYLKTGDRLDSGPVPMESHERVFHTPLEERLASLQDTLNEIETSGVIHLHDRDAADRIRAEIADVWRRIESGETHEKSVDLGEFKTDADGEVRRVDRPGSHKLDTYALKAMGLGSDALHQLRDYHEDGGLDPALVARVFGRDDAHELVQALKSYVPLEQAAATAAAARMPGWVDPLSWLRNRAVDKFTGEVVPKMLWAEFVAMGGKLGEGGVGNYDIIRTMVQTKMRNAVVSKLDPNHFLQEYHRLADEVAKSLRDEVAAGLKLEGAGQPGTEEHKLRAERADKLENDKTGENKTLAELLADKHGGTPEEWQARLDKKDTGEERLSAAELQHRRMVAFESWKAARQVREDASKVNALMDKMHNDMDLRKRVADNYGKEHVDAFDAATEAYGFHTPDAPAEHPIAEYVKEQVKKGADITEDPELKARATARTPIGQLSVMQLRHAQDFLESLYHYITKDVGKFDSGTGPKPLDPLVALFAKTIRDNVAAIKSKDPSRLRGMAASSTTAEHILRMLDNDIHGDIARATIDPMAAGQARSEAMLAAHEEVMKEAVKGVNDGSLGGDSTLRVRDTETTDRVTGKKIAYPGRTLSKKELLSAVLNYGSARNREALLKGYGITHKEFMAAVARDLSAKHIELVNKFWAEHEKYFPDVAETYAKRQGLVLEQVKAIPFKVEFADGTKATATGGYVPIKMSAYSRSLKEIHSLRNHPADSFEVRADMTMERQGSYGAVELDLGRVLSSVSAKIHYAAMAEPVAQVSKVLLHPEFQKAVTDTLGPEYNNQLFKWLRDKAHDGSPLTPLGDWDKTYRRLLSGVSQMSVGFNHLTAVKQLPFGISQATSKVGVGNMARAITNTMKDWKGTFENAIKESAVIRRMNDDPSLMGQLTPYDPNISVPLATKLGQIGHGKIFRTASDVRAYLSELGMAHQSNVRQISAVFAYEAAKLDAIKQGRPDVIAYAEAVVRQTVGGGDPSAFVSEPGMARGTVMLYSHMSLIASEILSSATMLKKNWGKKELLGLAASLTGFLAIPAISAAVISDDFKDMPSATDHPDKFASTMLRWEILGHGIGRATPIIGDAIEQLFAYDKPQNRIAGGPIGQATSTVRTLAQAATSDKKHLSDAIPAVMAATSILAHVPTNHIYKDMDLLEGILSGRYGQNAMKWYDIMAHGAKKEGFKP